MSVLCRLVLESASQAQKPQKSYVHTESSEEGCKCVQPGVGLVGADGKIGSEDHVAKREDDQGWQDE